MNNRVLITTNQDVLVLGDLHGDYDFFKKALALKDDKYPEHLLLFTGDYADRGSMGYEIICELSKLLDERTDIVALMGNHEHFDEEGDPQFMPCTLTNEVWEKGIPWDSFFKDTFTPFVNKLYLASVINKVLFVHAGINGNIKSRGDLSLPSNFEDIIWSDPSNGIGTSYNSRGIGVVWGADVTQRTLQSLGVDIIVRSHEPRKAKAEPYKEHDNKVWTLNSSGYYGIPFILNLNTNTTEYEVIR